jgi:murein DD-endopeptidase MepM/ murein hydrolase activator NlpD
VKRVLTVTRPSRQPTRVRLAVLCTVLAATLNLAVVPLSSADTAGDKKKLDANIAQLSTAIEGTSQDQARAVVGLQLIQARLPGARQALAAAEAAQGVADRNSQAEGAAFEVAQADAAKAADALVRNARQSQAVRDQLGNLVRNEYQQGGMSGLSMLLESTGPADFSDRLMMLDTVLRAQKQTLGGLGTRRAQGEADQAHLIAVRQQVAVLKARAEAALARATVARQTAAAAKTKLDVLYADQSRYEATVAARKATETASLNQLQAESDSLGRQLAARAKAAREAAARAAQQHARQSPRQNSAERSPQSSPQGPPQSSPEAAPPTRSGGFLSYPLIAPTSQEFRPQGDPLGYHPGLDLAASCGSPVFAAAGGDVIMTTPESLSGGYGNRLIIDHGLQRGVDLTTTYNHLTSFVVTSGHVARGQLIAYSGTTGFSTGCHLHFEAREDGNPVNPRLWL